MSNEPAVIISKAPDDPDEKEAWAQSMLRIQVAMWLPAECAECRKPYTSVDDFLERNPKAAPDFPAGPEPFVDSDCWNEEWDRRVAAAHQGEDEREDGPDDVPGPWPYRAHQGEGT